MKWKIVMIDVHTGESWELGKRLKQKLAVAAVRLFNQKTKGKTAFAVPIDIQITTHKPNRAKRQL